MQALEPGEDFQVRPYGSVYHWHEDNTQYTPEMLKSWSNRDLLLKHYHLTARLDGYGHLSASDTMKSNALIFREALRGRGIDGVQHCIQMDWLYDAGYRHVAIFYPPVKEA